MPCFGVVSALTAAMAVALTVAASTTSTASISTAEVANGNPDWSFLAQALTASNLVSVVVDVDAALSVFAPTDAGACVARESAGLRRQR